MFVDIEKTKKYYQNLTKADICDCEDCKLYCSKVKQKYSEVYDYLNKLGIDIEKPFETSPVELDDGFVSYYACQYIVFGNCEKDFFHKIGDIEFNVTASHPSTGIEEEHFVLTFSVVKLKK